MSRIRASLRQKVLQRANFECEYCRGPQYFLLADLEIDHIVPKAKNGQTVEANLCSACRKCNELKGVQVAAIDPESGKSAQLFHPRLHFWHDHFMFSPDGTLILGKTACGRATIPTLELNRPRAVALRRLWIKTGWFPSTS